mmetsp:Transcript_47115/g.131453  ORF Transcript_47115/g.131453 Transcript_47115/m.131453 type:complete len:273 (+) Transcript_47115:1171-1989(+)
MHALVLRDALDEARALRRLGPVANRVAPAQILLPRLDVGCAAGWGKRILIHLGQPSPMEVDATQLLDRRAPAGHRKRGEAAGEGAAGSERHLLCQPSFRGLHRPVERVVLADARRQRGFSTAEATAAGPRLLLEALNGHGDRHDARDAAAAGAAHGCNSRLVAHTSRCGWPAPAGGVGGGGRQRSQRQAGGRRGRRRSPQFGGRSTMAAAAWAPPADRSHCRPRLGHQSFRLVGGEAERFRQLRRVLGDLLDERGTLFAAPPRSLGEPIAQA